jgi:signal transduction histidine kinase
MQKKIMDETNQASNILQNLSRLTSQEESPAATVEPDIVLQDIIVSSRPLFENRNIRVKADLEPVGNVRIGQDDLRNALLDIFLFVASKASSGTPIKVALRRVDHSAAIEISFAGPPLSAAQREQLLQPFSAEGAAGGSLELAVAAMVFEEKGGRVLLESNQEGNALTAELPLA